MRPDILLLVFGYVLSQFYRSFLAVLTGPLEADLGATAADLSFASGVWFLVFAAMQIPVGWALDRIGPRRSSSVLLLVGGAGGAAVFALATEPWHLTAAMALLGVGCSNILMAAYYIFARSFAPVIFASLAAVSLGTGMVGNLAGSLPMALAAELIGWRACMAVMAVISGATALGLWVLIKDPPAPEGGPRGSLLDLLKMPAFWLLVPMILGCYAPTATLRGLWIGPYFADIYGASATQVGQAALVLGVAMILGTYAYGPLDRWLGTRKWVVFAGNAGALACLLGLILLPGLGAVQAALLFAGLGAMAASYPMLMAHGRAFAPPHLVGRAVTLVNLLALGSAGGMQVMSGWLYNPAAQGPAAFAPMLWSYAALMFVGLAVYLFAPDRMD
ncbi:MFS transporter [Pseudooceanicola aestuarii]|uniref:MFS transporter n=1 Tax=Pseudooceanicola aestuarii TaxID=2697319 RepID=UPI0013D738F5